MKACCIMYMLCAVRSQRYCDNARMLLGSTSVLLEIGGVMLLSAIVAKKRYCLKDMDR